jgi:DNA mismatch endonuclease (patch repair protein)
MADTITRERRSWNMSRIKGRDTGPELRLRSLLHRAGFRFRLHAKELPGNPDIVLPKYRAAIFVHGCFWHRHEGCRNATMPSTRTEFWKSKFASNVGRDERNQAALTAAGWTVFTVWECELKNDAPGVVEKLSYDIREAS